MEIFNSTPILWLLLPAGVAAIIAAYDIRYRSYTPTTALIRLRANGTPIPVTKS